MIALEGEGQQRGVAVRGKNEKGRECVSEIYRESKWDLQRNEG